MRFLFCSLSSWGFVSSTLAVAQELIKRNHDVAVVTGQEFAQVTKRAGVERLPRGVKDGNSFELHSWSQPLNVAMQVKHIEYALASFQADVIVGQPLALGSLLAAERCNLPIAVIGMMTYLWPGSAKHLETTLLDSGRLVWRFEDMVSHYQKARQLFRMPPAPCSFEKNPFTGDLFLLQNVSEIEVDLKLYPPCVHPVGACIPQPLSNEADEKELANWLSYTSQSAHPLVYIQPGRTFGDASFWSCLTEVLADQKIRVVASLDRMDDHWTAPLPQNFYARQHVPLHTVLSHASGTITSGHTTAVLASLSNGIPLLLIPRGSGTEDIAESCERAGVAVRLPLSEVTSVTLKHAIRELLDDKCLRSRASAIKDSFACIGGSVKAADLLETLAVTRRPVHRVCYQPSAS